VEFDEETWAALVLLRGGDRLRFQEGGGGLRGLLLERGQLGEHSATAGGAAATTAWRTRRGTAITATRRAFGHGVSSQVHQPWRRPQPRGAPRTAEDRKLRGPSAERGPGAPEERGQAPNSAG